MPILKWAVIELHCNSEGCTNSIRFEGNEQKFIDWVRDKGWKISSGKCYCPEHKNTYYVITEEGAN